MTTYAIFGYYGQGNTGDEAILAALIQGLTGDGREHEICVYSDNTHQTRTLHGIKAHLPVKLQPIRLIKGFIKKGRVDHLKALLQFLKTDVVIIGGGGLFFDSHLTNKWMVGYLKLIRASKRLKKKIAIVGVSVGPLHLPESADLIGRYFELADFISVRDQMSSDILVACGLPKERVKVIPDLVFSLDPARDDRIAALLSREGAPFGTRKIIAFTPCCYNKDMEGWHKSYIDLCERAVAELNVNLWFIPMQNSADNSDLKAIESLTTKLSPAARANSHVFSGSYAPAEVQGILGKADFVFAERLHGAIMAMTTGTPCLGISYMPKVTGVLALANQQERIITMSDFLSGAHTESSMRRMAEDIQTAERSLPLELRQGARTNFDDIAQLSSQP